MIDTTNKSINIYKDYWDIIDKALDEGTTSGYKIAIIETEKILKLAFNEKKIPGINILEKIHNSKEFMKNAEKLSYSHAMHERIINEPGFNISSEDTKEIVFAYYEAICDISDLKPNNISFKEKVNFFVQNHFKRYFFNLKNILIYTFLFFLSVFISTETSIGISISNSIASFTKFLFYTVIFGLLKIAIIITVLIGILYYLQNKFKK